MRRRLVMVGLIASLVGVGVGGWFLWGTNAAPPPPWTDDMQTVADANNRFALDLYAKLRDTKGNLFFSPYSVHTALAMTAVGARGSTREQMLKVLHLPDDNTLLAAGDLGRYYATPRRGCELSVANAIWGPKSFGWKPEFVALQSERFGTGFQEADFAANPDRERQRINRWAEDKTRDRIKDLLQPGQITSNTTMVLTNAIYFKGKWETEFTPGKTRDAPFHLSDGSYVQVPMMYTNAKCGIAGGVEGRVWAVELPYRTGELSMVVLLPQGYRQGLAELEQELTPETLAKLLSQLSDRSEIEVHIPRFEFESRFELPEHLRALGITDAFSNADFSGMASQSPGSIAHVSHKAFVKVNEEGTEAAAATAVAMKVSGPPVFYANEPFLFLIRDVKRRTILFMGRVEKP